MGSFSEDDDGVGPGADLERDELSSFTLLSSEERGEGRLSVSELLLGPPGEGRRAKVTSEKSIQL